LGKFGIYNIDLKELAPGVHDFEFLLDNKFFADIEKSRHLSLLRVVQ
jgi:hypothetical protein